MQTKNVSKATETCDKIMAYITSVGGNVFAYDSRIFDYDWAKISTNMRLYLTRTSKV